MRSDALNSVNALRQALAQARQAPDKVVALTTCASEHAALLASLPTPFATVWTDLLNRLESSALFNEDSCSFSQSQVLDSIALWLDKAEARLTTPSE